MHFMEWDESCSVKIKELDDQHKVLFRIVSDLFEAMKDGKANDRIASILEELKGYTATHFRTEEKYLKDHGYPQLSIQIEEHKSFEKEIADFQRDILAHKVGLSVKVSTFLKEWLMNHIMQKDKNYSGFLYEKGVR